MRKIYQRFNDMRIRNKIWIMFCGMIVLVTISISIYYQNQHNKRLESTIRSRHFSTLQQIGSDLQFLQNDIRDISTYLSIDGSVQRLIKENLTEK